MNEYTKSQALINSIIGEGTSFRGNMELEGLLRIDGDFEGNIKTTGRVLVGKSGRAGCFIEADAVVIGGAVKGNIKAKSKVVLLSTSVVIGNISSPLIIVEAGVLFHGHCTISKDAKVLAEAPAGDDEMFSVDWGHRKKQSPSTSQGN